MIKVLVADDEELIRWSLTQTLTSSGYSVDQALNGREVISSLENNTYDVIVTDYNMPELNGIEVLAIIRSMGIHLPVIVISAYFSNKLKEETISSGAFECISKPFEMDDVLDVVKKAIGTQSGPAHHVTH